MTESLWAKALLHSAMSDPGFEVLSPDLQGWKLGDLLLASVRPFDLEFSEPLTVAFASLVSSITPMVPDPIHEVINQIKATQDIAAFCTVR